VRLTKALLHARDEVFFATTFTIDIADRHATVVLTWTRAGGVVLRAVSRCRWGEEREMTADGGTKPENSGKEPVWNDDRARIALEQAAEVYAKNPVAKLPELRERVPDYQLIPEEIRQTIEALSDEEHRLLDTILDLLEKYDIYLYSYSRRGGTPEFPPGIPELNPVFPTGGY
jgi:hypothetical protein